MELLEMERELVGTDRQAAMAKYDEQLFALGARLRAAMDAGLAPDDFAKCEPLAEVVVIARKLIRLQVQE